MTRKIVTTTHSQHTVHKSMSEKIIKLMEAPYETTIAVRDSETGKEETNSRKTYIILYRGLRPSENQVWDGTDWTADTTKAAYYVPGEFPAKITSLKYLYELEVCTQYGGVPEKYEPPDEYWEEYRRATPIDSSEYEEPGEWLVDEYRASLYIVIPVDDLDEWME